MRHMRQKIIAFWVVFVATCMIAGCFRGPAVAHRFGAYTPPSGGTSLLQDSWYIDTANASGTALDTNDGHTSTTALRTHAELLRRWGPAPRFGLYVNIYELSDMSGSDPMRFALAVDDNYWVSWYLSPNITIGSGSTSVQTGTFSSVTNLAASSNTATQATDSLGRSWTTLLGKRVRDLTSGAIAWPVKDLGSGAVRLTPPSTWFDDFTDFPTTTTFGTVHTYRVETLRKAYVSEISLTSGTANSGSNGKLWIQDADFQNTSAIVVNSTGPSVTFRGCHFSSVVEVANTGLGFTNFSNSYIESVFAVAGGGGTIFLGGGIKGLSTQPSFQTTGVGVATIDADALIQGGAGISVPMGSVVLGRVGIFDTVVRAQKGNPRGSAIVVGGQNSTFSSPAGGHVRIANFSYGAAAVYGSGNAGYGIDVFPAHSVDVQSTAAITVTGSSGDFILGEDSTAATPFDKGASPPAYKAAVTGSWTNFAAALGSGGFAGNATNPTRGAGIFTNSVPPLLPLVGWLLARRRRRPANDTLRREAA